MIIGKGTSEDKIVTTEVDFNRDIKFNGLAIQVPTKVSIIYVGGRYFCRCDEDPPVSLLYIMVTTSTLNGKTRLIVLTRRRSLLF